MAERAVVMAAQRPAFVQTRRPARKTETRESPAVFTTTVRLPVSLAQRLKAEAMDRMSKGHSARYDKSDVICEALEEYFERRSGEGRRRKVAP